MALACALGAMLLGCRSGDAYSCVQDDQCVGASERGVCESNGFCSFPDAECASGSRFGERAPVGIAGECVTPVDVGSGSGGTTGDDGPDPDGMGASMGTSAGVDPTRPATDEGDDALTSGSTGTTSGAATSETTTGAITTGEDGSTGDTGGPADACVVDFVDEFDGPALDAAWSTYLGPGASIAPQQGELRITIPAAIADPSPWINANAWVPPAAMAGGYARVRLDQPDVDVPMIGLVGFSSASCEFQTTIGWGEVGGFVWDDENNEGIELGHQPLPIADQPLWLQVRVTEDGADIVFEYSTDELVWTEVGSTPIAACDENAGDLLSAFVGAGSDELSQPTTKSFSVFSRCTVP